MTAHAAALPTVEYAEVDPGALIPPSVQDQAVVPFGFNDGSVWSGAKEGENGEGDGGYLRYQREFSVPSASETVCPSQPKLALGEGWILQPLGQAGMALVELERLGWRREMGGLGFEADAT